MSTEKYEFKIPPLLDRWLHESGIGMTAFREAGFNRNWVYGSPPPLPDKQDIKRILDFFKQKEPEKHSAREEELHTAYQDDKDHKTPPGTPKIAKADKKKFGIELGLLVKKWQGTPRYRAKKLQELYRLALSDKTKESNYVFNRILDGESTPRKLDTIRSMIAIMEFDLSDEAIKPMVEAFFKIRGWDQEAGYESREQLLAALPEITDSCDLIRRLRLSRLMDKDEFAAAAKISYNALDRYENDSCNYTKHAENIATAFLGTDAAEGTAEKKLIVAAIERVNSLDHQAELPGAVKSASDKAPIPGIYTAAIFGKCLQQYMQSSDAIPAEGLLDSVENAKGMAIRDGALAAWYEGYADRVTQTQIIHAINTIDGKQQFTSPRHFCQEMTARSGAPGMRETAPAGVATSERESAGGGEPPNNSKNWSATVVKSSDPQFRG